ncbi:hypothetical protein VB10N_31920 [Vibrio sp. 10N]|nr:hypothetical protein VB10N_31920 [Vibrio sp. 10N]
MASSALLSLLAGSICPPQDDANLTQTFIETMPVSVNLFDRDTLFLQVFYLTVLYFGDEKEKCHERS